MKTALGLLVACLLCAALASSQPSADTKPVWHSDWPTAQRLARQANKPIFAVLVCKH